MITKLQNGNILKLSKEESDYLNWRKLSPKQKRQIRISKAKTYLNSGPNIANFWEAFQTYIGNRDPENPNLQIGDVPTPGWGKQGITGLHKIMAKLPEAKLVLIAPLAGRSRAAATLKMKDIVKAQLHRDEVYKRWASLYKQEYDPTPTTFRTKPAKVRRLETDISKSNGRTLAGGKGNAGGSYNRKSHTINVTTSKTVSAKNLEDIGFHEGIHSYGLGESPSYLWKTRYLNFPEETNPYSLDPREIATHGIQQGQNLGIKVGQPYPGKEEMIKMIENRPDGLGFGGIPYTLYNNAKTDADYRRLWSLLNGTFKNGGVIKASKGTAFGLKVSNALGKVGNFLNSDTGKLAVNGITSMIGTAVLNRAIDKQIEANNKMKEVDIQKAKLDRYRKLLGLQDMTPEIDSSGNIINKSSIVALNNAYKQAMESTDTSEILDAYDRVNRLLGNEKYMNLKGMLGDMVGTLSSILGGKKKDNNSSNNSYFGNYVNILYKNPGTYNSDGSFNTSLGTYKWEDGKLKNISNTYGTFNADGSMNLGNGLGTFSIKDGYKPRKLY